MSSKSKYLFGPYADKWHYNESYLHFVTPFQIRHIIASHAKKQYPRTTCIWDMFSGIGCDSVTLNQVLRAKIICTELNVDTYDNLCKNTAANSNIRPYNKDCSEFVPDVVPDLIFFDPPWGSAFESGKGFDFNQVNLHNGTNVIELLHQIVDTYGNVIVKAPYDCTTFEDEFEPLITKIYAFPKPKLKFLFIQK